MSKIKMFALGGLNEVGKNMYVVEVDKDIFVFESGLKYADDQSLGIDYILPNYDYLIENADRIQGVFITHGHDNEIGAVCDIIHDIPNIKVFATKFSCEIIKQDLEEENMSFDNLHEIKVHQKIEFGKNSIYPIRISHSIPDAVMYVLNTADGAIVFTGNYLFDPAMTGLYSTDMGKIAYVGKQGVLCLLNESIFAPKASFTSPSHRASNMIKEIINKHDKRIIFTIMQAQIFRIQEIFDVISKTDRSIVIMGKRLENIINRAIELGFLNLEKERIKNIHHINDENVIILMSNERESSFQNMQRAIKGFDKFLKLTEDDLVVLASPIYDSQEVKATKVRDDLAKIGIETVVLKAKSLHSSAEDIMMMINMLNPKYYFPVSGEYRQQVENANLAYRLGMSEDNVFLKLNGQVVEIDDGVFHDNEEVVKTDEILIDGKQSGDIGDLVLKDRELLGSNGIVFVTVTLDKETKKILAGPEILTRGFIYVKDNTDLINEALVKCHDVIEESTTPQYVDFNKVKIGIRDRLGKFFYDQTSSKPMIIVNVQEI